MLSVSSTVHPLQLAATIDLSTQQCHDGVVAMAMSVPWRAEKPVLDMKHNAMHGLCSAT
jgi:hypothetical protein